MRDDTVLQIGVRRRRSEHIGQHGQSRIVIQGAHCNHFRVAARDPLRHAVRPAREKNHQVGALQRRDCSNNRIAGSVDPVQVLDEKNGALLEGQALNDGATCIGNGTRARVRLQLAPARILDRNIQYGIDRELMDCLQLLSDVDQTIRISGGNFGDRKYNALERAERHALKVRAALGVDQPPAIGLELLGELMCEPRFSDACIADQKDRLPACTGPLGGASQQGPLGRSIDKPRNAPRTSHPPA